MTLLIACLLIYVGDMHYGWYIAATWLWLLKQFLWAWRSFYDVGDPA